MNRFVWLATNMPALSVTGYRREGLKNSTKGIKRGAAVQRQCKKLYRSVSSEQITNQSTTPGRARMTDGRPMLSSFV